MHQVLSIKQLPSYDDCNFYIECEGEPSSSFLVKFYNGVDSLNIDMLSGLGMQSHALFLS